MHPQGAAPAIARTEEVEGDGPHGRVLQGLRDSDFRPPKKGSITPVRRLFPRVNRNGLSRKKLKRQFEAIKVVAAECREQDSTHLLIVAGDLQFLSGATDRQIIDENLGLIQRAMGNAGQLSKFQISEMLNADPDSDSQYRKHQTERASCWPQ